MDKGHIAERVLSLAMEPARAASVTGDLLETGVARGGVWYWSNVLQTLAGTVWRDLRSQPLFFLGLAARGALLLSGFLLCVWYARGFVFGFVRSVSAHSGLARHPREWLWPAVRLASVLAAFYAGEWIARRSLGKDAAACVAMSLLFPFIYYGSTALSLGYASLGAHREFLLPPFGRFWYHWRDIAFMAAFLLGMALVRRRQPIAGPA